MNNQVRRIFFGYEGNHPDLHDAVKAAVSDYNKYQHSFIAKTWEELRTGGTIINKTILENIDNSEIFACDVTYLNYNVMFELGYAIGRRKKVLIFLNPSITGAKNQYAAIKTFQGIAYAEYQTSNDIRKELDAKAHCQIQLIDQLDRIEEYQANSVPLMFLSSQVESQAALDLKELIYELNVEVIVNDTTEILYQTRNWLFRSINKARNVIIHLVGVDRDGHHALNTESSFFAGLACALGKNVLLLAPAPFRPPIDYEDILIQYANSTECALRADDWIKERIRNDHPFSPPTTAPSKEDTLLDLGIGDPQAEKEKNQLHHYFIQFEAYKRARIGDAAVFVGKKGSGKTALFLTLEHEYNQDNENFNIILKPEADELLSNIELSKLFNSPYSKQTFLLSIWKFVFYTKLLSTLATRLIPRDGTAPYNASAEEQRIIELFDKNRGILGLNFFGAIKKINDSRGTDTIIKNPDLLNELFERYLAGIPAALKDYFSSKKYAKINILADNLDRAWESPNNLELQSSMIFSLIELSGRIINEIAGERASERSKIVILLRQDIFDYIVKYAPEPDKLISVAYVINWDRHRNLLKALIEERFRHSLRLPAGSNVEHVWQDYFNFGTDPFEKISRAVAPRPRDYIYFVGRLFESAINSGNTSVTNSDFAYASESYAHFLDGNLLAEIKPEFPEFQHIFQEIENISRLHTLDMQDLIFISDKFGISGQRFDALMEELFSKEYIRAFSKFEPNHNISSYTELRKALKKRRWLFFSNQITTIINPVSSLLRQERLPFA